MNHRFALPDSGDAATYLDDLVTHLRLLDVPGVRIGEIMAETESHLAESGEDPAEAFGEPRDYARELAEREGVTLPRVSHSDNPLAQLFSVFRPRDWVTLVGGTLVIGAGIFVGLGGILNLAFGNPVPFGLDPWVAIGIGVAVAIGCWIWMRVVTDPVVDPRTGRQVQWDLRGRRRTDA